MASASAALKAAATGQQVTTQQDRPKTIAGLLTDPTIKAQLALALPKHMTADRLARIALTEVRKVPKLAQCDQTSFLGAIMQCASLGLEPGGAWSYLGGMKDLNALMQQAQAMQQKLQDAQAKMAESTAEGTSGGGLVTIALKGPGEITSVKIDDSLMTAGEGEILADLIVAAHADAKRKLDEVNNALMRDAAGPMAGMNIPGMPKLF